MRSYLVDLFWVGWSSLRAHCHCLATLSLARLRVCSLSSGIVIKCFGVEIPLERTDVLVCSCGKIFYERNAGGAQQILRVLGDIDERLHG